MLRQDLSVDETKKVVQLELAERRTLWSLMRDAEMFLLRFFEVGSGKCKAGIAGEEYPSCVFPSIIGRPKTEPPSMSRAVSHRGECDARLW